MQLQPNGGMSLYAITGRFFELQNKAADEALTPEELQEQMDELGTMLQQKTPGLVAYYRNMDAAVQAMKAEETRLAEMRKRVEKQQERYKAYIKDCMDRMGIIEISTDLGKLKIAKNPLSVDILDADLVPAEYKTTVQPEPVTTVNRAAIKDHFKETGEMLPGLKYNVSNTRLDIK